MLWTSNRVFQLTLVSSYSLRDGILVFLRSVACFLQHDALLILIKLLLETCLRILEHFVRWHKVDDLREVVGQAAWTVQFAEARSWGPENNQALVVDWTSAERHELCLAVSLFATDIDKFGLTRWAECRDVCIDSDDLGKVHLLNDEEVSLKSIVVLFSFLFGFRCDDVIEVLAVSVCILSTEQLINSGLDVSTRVEAMLYHLVHGC